MGDHERDDSGDLGRDLMRRLAERDERSRSAHAVAAELMGLPAAERPGFVRTHPDCLGSEFIELMIAMARERRGPAPEESVTLAHLAATAAEAAHDAGSDRVDEARALAFAELGNAHRICGDLRRAGIAFRLARERVRFAADPLVRAEVDSLEASYLDQRNKLGEAERLLARAERTQRKVGSPHAVGRIRLQRGSLARRDGDPERAMRLLQSGFRLLDTAQEPRLALVAIHNIASCLIDANEPDAALSLLRRHRSLYNLTASATDRARLGWIEGIAARAAGLIGLAEANLEEVRDEFAELGRPYETGLVLLDLAEIYALGSRWDELEKAATATLVLCRANGIEPEGVAAAGLLVRAAERRQSGEKAIAALTAAIRQHLLSAD